LNRHLLVAGEGLPLDRNPEFGDASMTALALIEKGTIEDAVVNFEL
jgi:hypothetical protein